MDFNTWVIFTITIALVIGIPGPLTLLMVNSSINLGMKRSMPIILGGSTASSILITISALGLGAIIAASETAFYVIKYIGAAYLIYLGISLWLTSKANNQEGAEGADESKKHQNLLLKSFTLGITNPKDIVFFIAFLPQFISPQESYLTQLILIVATWFAVDFLCKVLYGVLARAIVGRINNARKTNILDRVSALVFVAAGVAATI
ncbi:Lysine exporter protein (LYSE/YGGA) [Marinomonas sp. MED121]|uniref:LysE family translocator n=1 Tax=Marinomonas sp. MED121 TaxID=314277 RepID=UPI0000690F97|nr:LysE family translocator [Marinomonas sp. MED121]EAQ67143.1 Lysine exporter protein (LYSE/YGGA) [Marinomonas sp. MED121]